MTKKKRVELKVKINLWRIVLIGLTLLFLAPFFLALFQNQIDEGRLDLSAALSDIKDNKVKEVEVQEEKIVLIYPDDTKKIAVKEASISFPELLERNGIDPNSVKYYVSDQTITRAVTEVIGILLPLAVMAIIFILIIRMQNKGAQDIFSFGRSKAKLFAKGKQDVSFKDVAVVDDAKKELEEVVDFLKNPAK